MKTTLDLPDDLVRAVKLRAVDENRRIKDVVADALRRGLAMPSSRQDAVRTRVKLPLIAGGHRAAPGEEVTSARAAEILLEDEAAATSTGR